MKRGPVVSNASPLIGLERIGQLSLLPQIFSSVVIPTAVADEVFATARVPDWIEVNALQQVISAQVLQYALGRGESEAISLAVEVGARLLIIDDRPARRLAQALHLPVIGTLRILLLAKSSGLVQVVRPSLDALVHHGFRISPGLYKQVLNDAGEVL